MNPIVFIGRVLVVLVFFCFLPTEAGPPKRQQTQMKGLLVIQLPNGSFAGTASQMNATVLPSSIKGSFEVDFNQSVGPMMDASTEEVAKLMQVRNSGKLPTGHRIEFAFADKHSPKDGPSAAVACALMAESIITGVPLDQSLAVTGDITATGAVRPIGGVGAKISGATKQNCKIMAIPSGNKSALHDMYVIDGVTRIAQSQVILIETFDQALKIAVEQKSPEVQQALKDYEQVQAAVSRSEGNAAHPKVLEKLKSIVQAIPNHESARLIALHAVGKGPQKLSLEGSLEAIDQASNHLADTMKSGTYVNKGQDDPLWASVTSLAKLRDNVDPRTKDYLDAFLKTASFLKNHRDRAHWPASIVRDFRTAVSGIEVEATKLKNNNDIQEELMKQ